MTPKQNSSDRNTSNGGNSAIWICKSNGSKKADEDLSKLAEICFKSTNPLTLYAPKNLNSAIVDELLQSSKIRISSDGRLDEDIKNAIALKLPLSNDAEVICKWIQNANKVFNGSNMVAADGSLSSKSGYFEKYLSYCSNFWQKLFTGSNSKQAACEAVVLSKEDFTHLVIDKRIHCAWQIAALGEKEGICSKLPLELKPGSFKIGDGFKSFASGFSNGIQTIVNYFFKAATPGKQVNEITDINHPVYKKAFGISALVLLFGMLFISSDYNVTWDEPNHNNYSQDVLDYYLTTGKDTSMFDFKAEGHRDNFTNVLYGMGIDVFSSAVNRVLGLNEKAEKGDILGITFTGDNFDDTLYNNTYKRYTVDENGFIEHKSFGKINIVGKSLSEIKSILREKADAQSLEASISVNFYSFKPHYKEFLVRHIINTITGFLAILFTALMVRRFSGWMPALLALIAIVCSPSFFGHAFNNPKDIPFAAGYIMSLYYLIRLLKELPNAGHQTKVMLALSIGFTLSIRVQGLLPILFIVVFVFLHWLLTQASKKDNHFVSYLKIGLAICITGYILGILFWPFALRDPISGPLKANAEFDQFSYLTYYELFDGNRVFNKPWIYETKLIFLTAPIAILIGLIPGFLFGWKRGNRSHTLSILLLVIATIFPIFWVAYQKSYVYNGWRHVIFIYPSLVAISILGWFWLVTLFKSAKVRTIVLGVVAITFLKPGIWSIVNHPYQYLYFNEIAGGVEGANGKYELDYWNQTPRAAFEWLIKNKPEVLNGDIKVSSNNIQEALKTFVPEGKNVKYAWTREYEWADNDWTYAIWTTRTLSKNQILGGYWPPKGTIHEIKVDGVTIAAVVKSENNFSYLGKQYLKKNNGDSAIYYYEKAYAFNPLEEEYARGLADACKLKMKFDSAITFYKKAIALRDGNYEALQSLGEIYYTQAMMKDNQNPDPALINLAFENMELAFKHKKNSSAPLIMGEIRLMQNNPEEAKGYFNQFLTVYSNVGRGYLGLAKAQLLLGETDSAFYNLQGAMQFEPRNPEAYYIMGTELQKAGRNKDAEQFLNEYMKLSGTLPQ